MGAITSPLAVHSSGRYFVDSGTQTPVRLKIDAAWIMSVHSEPSDQNTYMDAIVRLGYNGFVLMNIVHAGGPSWTNINEPNDLDNVAPFTTPNDFSTANDTYFNKIADIVERARQRGLYVAFFHTYSGFQGGNDGWEAVYSAASNTVNFNWGVYLANKFTHANILWMNGGDHTQAGSALTGFQHIVSGIQSITRNRLAGAEWTGAQPLDSESLVTSQTGFTYGTNPATTDMQIDWIYGVGPSNNGLPYTTVDAGWQVSPPMPVVLGEPDYFNVGNHPTRSDVRREQHWAMTSGSIGGSNSGYTGRWDWQPANWQATLTGNATIDQSHLFGLYDSIAWWNLRPSGTAAGYCGRLLIVSSNTQDSTWISSSMTVDGSLLLAYVPPTGVSGTTFQVDLRSMSKSVDAFWWNPTSGGYSAKIGTFSNTASAQSFTTPGDNGTGTNDWVLVLQITADVMANIDISNSTWNDDGFTSGNTLTTTLTLGAGDSGFVGVTCGNTTGAAGGTLPDSFSVSDGTHTYLSIGNIISDPSNEQVLQIFYFDNPGAGTYTITMQPKVAGVVTAMFGKGLVVAPITNGQLANILNVFGPGQLQATPTTNTNAVNSGAAQTNTRYPALMVALSINSGGSGTPTKGTNIDPTRTSAGWTLGGGTNLGRLEWMFVNSDTPLKGLFTAAGNTAHLTQMAVFVQLASGAGCNAGAVSYVTP